MGGGAAKWLLMAQSVFVFVDNLRQMEEMLLGES